MLLKIIVRNLLHKPLGTLLSVVLLTLSVGIISLLLLMQTQLEQKFENDLKDIDLVLGAKGSPLQLVLSAVYHVDAPTGNISEDEVAKIAKSRLVKQVIPLAYGDSYQSFRLLGTDTNYVAKYGATLRTGKLFDADLEAVIGANVAQRTGLTVGQTFFGTHGEAAEGEKHEHAAYRVVGILNESNTVLDNLILTTVGSVWRVHDEGHHDEEEAKGEGQEAKDKGQEAKGKGQEGEHHDDHDHAHAEADTTPRQITAALVKFRSPMALMTLPRMVNENTKMQAAVPALEINRLMKLMGIGVTTLQALAVGIMLISGFSVFIALYNRLRERRYELALLRSLGCSRLRLFGLLISEGLLLALGGFAGGLLLSRLGIWLLNSTAAQDFHLVFRSNLIPAELWLGGVTLAVGLLAALIPAAKAFRMNLSTALADA